MKVLLDTCVWNGVAKHLNAVGYDVVWTGEFEDPGDEEILARAFSEQRILVTLDKDFGELAILRSLPHCGIVRLVNFGTRDQGDVCLAVLSKHGDELLTGAIITAERGRIRIRSPEGG